MDNLTFRNNLKFSMETVYTFRALYSLKLSMDNVIVYMETVYNSSDSTNLTRNLNKNRKKSIKLTQVHASVTYQIP